MVRLPISKHTLPDKHWLVYVNDDGVKKHIDLSGCAGSFERSTGYVSQDGLRAVGWRYAQNGQLCYELFNVGHTVVWGPLQPNPIRALLYTLSGKDPREAHSAFLASFEEALAKGGWKTVPREEVQP